MLRFFPSFEELELDIVGFLAILGEGSILVNAQVSTLSNFIFLPRLLPAPQALLRPSRPSELEPVRGWVTGVNSGNARLTVNHVGHLLMYAGIVDDYRIGELTQLQRSRLHAGLLGPLRQDYTGQGRFSQSETHRPALHPRRLRMLLLHCPPGALDNARRRRGPDSDGPAVLTFDTHRHRQQVDAQVASKILSGRQRAEC